MKEKEVRIGTTQKKILKYLKNKTTKKTEREIRKGISKKESVKDSLISLAVKDLVHIGIGSLDPIKGGGTKVTYSWNITRKGKNLKL